MREGRAIHLVRLDKVRPAVILTREAVRPFVTLVTVAPIVTRVRGLRTEVAVGPQNGLDHVSVIHCDTVTSVSAGSVGKQVGRLLPDQERELARAIVLAFDLEDDE